MTNKEKIDYMIHSLELVKEEIEYGEDYFKNSPTEPYNYNRCPNGTLIRETLKTVGRLSNIVAKNVTLGLYGSKYNEIFNNKKKEGDK